MNFPAGSNIGRKATPGGNTGQQNLGIQLTNLILYGKKQGYFCCGYAHDSLSVIVSRFNMRANNCKDQRLLNLFLTSFKPDHLKI